MPSNEPAAEPQTQRQQAEEEMIIPIERSAPTTNIPLDQYREEHEGQPFASEFFKLETPFTYLPADVQDKLADIDRYMETEIAERGLVHNVSSYQMIASELAMDLDMDETSTLDQIERLAGYARNMIKLDGLDDIRKTLKHQLKRMRRQKDMDAAVLRAIGKKII